MTCCIPSDNRASVRSCRCAYSPGSVMATRVLRFLVYQYSSGCEIEIPAICPSNYSTVTIDPSATFEVVCSFAISDAT